MYTIFRVFFFQVNYSRPGNLFEGIFFFHTLKMVAVVLTTTNLSAIDRALVCESNDSKRQAEFV